MLRCDSESNKKPVTPPGVGKVCHVAGPTGLNDNSRIIKLNNPSRITDERSASGRQPYASTIHDCPGSMGESYEKEGESNMP